MHRLISTYLLGISITVLLAFDTGLAEVDSDIVEKGMKAYQNEQWDQALNYFQDALLGEPENPLLYFNIATALYKKQKYEEALKSYDKALSTDDVMLQQSIYYNRGNTYYQMQKYKEAINAYKKALDLEPSDRDAKYNLELVRAKLKEMADTQQQQNQQQKQIEPSEYAKQLKAQADALIAQRLYKAAYELMMKGLKSDPTVKAYQAFISRLKNIVDIEEAV
ncbi:DUF3808 domain-containing protein [Candidatus Saccharibacteria bacterium]|nr:DUF3808 domain-containing protein [Candidatus Saccharibacteria bacterium]NIV04223.1 DUF3808 domain-containing protein [Calditrichia bacterium]NIV72673.1 DUF3808 domain-containing protein [Calditrichia bacterium]NIV99831.1 DUF3808 domain-containing protein [Candidatus Saccharibacteria bacterium]NIW79492.1 DUF3808 domain-containing protein [Calditrichia bacterium]